MRTKCYFQDVGFCKYNERCQFQHSEGVCPESTCRSRSCSKRHPRPCRNFFIKRYCRFGQSCKYAHTFECEPCENLKFLIDKENKRVVSIVKEKDETIVKMENKISEAKLEILRLKSENNNLLKELAVSKENGGNKKLN